MLISTTNDDGTRTDAYSDLNHTQWYQIATNWFDARGNFHQQTGVDDKGDAWVAIIENGVVQSWTVKDGGANDAWSTVVNKEYDAQRGEWRSLEIRYDDGTWSRSYLNDDGDYTELSVSLDRSVTIRDRDGASIRFDGASLSHAVYRVGEDSETISLDPAFYQAPLLKLAEQASKVINTYSKQIQTLFVAGIWALSEAGQLIYNHLSGQAAPAGIPDGSQFIFSTEDGTNYYTSPEGKISSISRDGSVSEGIDLAPGQILATDKDGFCTWVTVNRNGVSDQALEFQQRITGIPKGMECRVGKTDFDGFDYLKGVYLEAKGTGYNQHYYANGELKDLWFSGDEEWKEQMKRQVEAANGIVIEWHIAEDATNGFIEAVKEYISDQRYMGRVIVVKEKP